ncbi:unnamed protein product [Ascophyllum nodosum]
MESSVDVSLIEKEREDLQAELTAAEERLPAVDEAGATKAGGVEAVAEPEVDHSAGDGMESCVDVPLIEKEREDLQAKLAAAEERLPAVDEAGATKAGGVEAVTEPEVDHPAGGGMESCVDVSLIEKERKDLQAKLAAAEERLLTLQKEADSREADHFSALGSCGTDKDALLKEVEAVRREAEELTEALKEAKTLAEKAAAADATQEERDGAARLAAEQQAQLKSELDDLRKKLSGAEAKAREAWEEVEKHADGNEEVRRKLERTASELEIAQKPRKVSVAAILADLRYLFDDLVHQSADARDDIVSKGTVQWEKTRKAIQPYYKIAREVVDPQLEKAMSVTAPQREKAAEVVAQYWVKIDDAVMKPAGEKWAEITPIASKAARQAWAKWQAFEVDLHRRLINAGLSKDQADKVTKYAYFGVMATVAVIFLLYLAKPLLSYVVILWSGLCSAGPCGSSTCRFASCWCGR